jgi:hypothetical protein
LQAQLEEARHEIARLRETTELLQLLEDDEEMMQRFRLFSETPLDFHAYIERVVVKLQDQVTEQRDQVAEQRDLVAQQRHAMIQREQQLQSDLSDMYNITPFQARCLTLRLKIETACRTSRAVGAAIRSLNVSREQQTMLKKAHNVCCEHLHFSPNNNRDFTGRSVRPEVLEAMNISEDLFLRGYIAS